MRPAGPAPTTATRLPVSGSWRTRLFHSPVSRTAAARFRRQTESGAVRSLRLHSASQSWLQMEPRVSGNGTFSRTTAVAASHSPSLTWRR